MMQEPELSPLTTRINPATDQLEYSCVHRMFEGANRSTWRDETVWHNRDAALKCLNFKHTDRLQVVRINVNEKSDPADVAAQLLTLNHIATVRDTGQIYVWSDGVYRPDGETLLKRQVEAAAKDCGFPRVATNHFVAK